MSGRPTCSVCGVRKRADEMPLGLTCLRCIRAAADRRRAEGESGGPVTDVLVDGGSW